MTEICFQRCTNNLNYRTMTMDEEHCLDSCAGKLIRSNHRLMATYVQLMPGIVQRRLAEYESKAEQMAQASRAGTSPDQSIPLPVEGSALPEHSSQTIPSNSTTQAPDTPH
ncbi:T10B translocase, partial [Amia calva]|nr:T10B translocase [Amia calva]